MTNLPALLEKLESATEGSRELDAAVYNAFPELGRIAVRLPMEQWKGRFDDGWRTKRSDQDDKYPEQLKQYTSSIDAAQTLLGRQYTWRIQVDEPHGDAEAWVEKSAGDFGGILADDTRSFAPTAALALCIAALKARNQ